MAAAGKAEPAGRPARWTQRPGSLARFAGLYDAPRAISDVFRLRHAAGPDIANEALRRWLRNGGKPADLMRLTKSFPGARPALLHALQVLL
jgi:hypothetical protein